MPKDSKKSSGKKSSDKKSKENKSVSSKKSKSSKSSSKEKKDGLKKKSSKKLDIGIETKNNNNIPPKTLDLNTNFGETAQNLQNKLNYGLTNGLISPTSMKDINYEIQNSIESPNLKVIKPINEIKCEGCLEQAAVCYCTECKKSFCVQCENQIHTIPAMQNHIRCPIQEISNIKKMCMHHNQDLGFYCSTCDEPICKDCQQIGPHNTKYHIIISIKEAFEKKCMKITNLIGEKLNYRYEKLNMNIKIIDKFLEKIISDSNEAEREINKYFNSMLCNLKNETGKRLSKLDYETGFIQNNINDLEEMKDYVYDTKENNGDLIEFLMKYEKMKEKMENILDKPKKLKIDENILELPYEINNEKEKMIKYAQIVKELKMKNNEIFNLLNETKVYCDNEIMKKEQNLIVLSNKDYQNDEKSNNRYSTLKRPSNASSNKFYVGNDLSIKKTITQSNYYDLLKRIQDIMEEDLNLYQIFSDYKSEEKMDCIDINEIPNVLSLVGINTDLNEVNHLLDLLGIQRGLYINIKNFLIKVILYKKE